MRKQQRAKFGKGAAAKGYFGETAYLDNGLDSLVISEAAAEKERQSRMKSSGARKAKETREAGTTEYMRIYEEMREAAGNINDNEIAALFSKSGIQPKVCFTAWDNQTILAMVSKGLGVSVLTELMFADYPYDVVAVPLEPAAYRDLALATRREGELTAAVQTFINTAVDWIGRRYGTEE